MDAPSNGAVLAQGDEENRLVFIRGAPASAKETMRKLLLTFGPYEELFASGKKGCVLAKFEEPQSAVRTLSVFADDSKRDAAVDQVGGSRTDFMNVTAAVGNVREKVEGLDMTTEVIRREWKREQNALRARIVETDDFPWAVSGEKQLRLIGGMDISFVKDNNVDACAALVVIAYPSLMVVYENYKMVKLTAPYIPGFLAFREVPHLMDMLNTLRGTRPECVPDVIFLDGNGVLHPRGCGVACHFGVLSGVVTIGVAKTLMYVDGLGMETVKPAFRAACAKAGDVYELKGESGRVWGLALKASDDSNNPVFVSVGHRISVRTALALTMATAKYRIPEAIRQADLRSREYIRTKYKPAA